MSRLVAHRGQKATFPENTIESMQEAIACGATAVEFDVQLTADGVPVVSHDLSISKTAGTNIRLSEVNYVDIKNISVSEESRFNNKFQNIPLPSLRVMVELLKQHPQVKVFVELKQESVDVFGAGSFLSAVIEEIKLIEHQSVLIADSLLALIEAKKLISSPIGWIIHEWEMSALEEARKKDVDYLVIDYLHCQGVEHDFSSDKWDWVIYGINDASTAISLFNSGIKFVETDDICSMLKALPEYK